MKDVDMLDENPRKKKSRSNNHSISFDLCNLGINAEPIQINTETSQNKGITDNLQLTLSGSKFSNSTKFNVNKVKSNLAKKTLEEKIVHSYAIPNGLIAIKSLSKLQKSESNLYQPKISEFMRRFDKKPAQLFSIPVIRRGVNGWKLSSTTVIRKA